MRDEILRAAEARALRYEEHQRPQERHASEHPFGHIGAVLRSDGLSVRSAAEEPATGNTIAGFASVTEVGYEMYDLFGPYTETVARDAFDATLAASPLVEFTINHARGAGTMPLAHTRSGTLTLSVVKSGDVTGLYYEARLNPDSVFASEVLKAVQRGDLAESSFKFSITRGQWSPDFTEYRIEQVDLNRGDVSAVNFGANPNATAEIRQQVADLAGAGIDIDDLAERIAARLAPTTPATQPRRLVPAPHRDLRF